MCDATETSEIETWGDVAVPVMRASVFYGATCCYVPPTVVTRVGGKPSLVQEQDPALFIIAWGLVARTSWQAIAGLDR